MTKRYVGNENDLRVRKTKRAIREATIRLMQEHPESTPTVKAITEAAEINKSTFYYHFETVQELLSLLEQELFERAMQESLANIRLAFNEPRAFLSKFADFAYAPSCVVLRGNTPLKTSLFNSLLDQATDQAESGESAFAGTANRAALEVLLIGLWGLSRRVGEEEFRESIPALARFMREGLSEG